MPFTYSLAGRPVTFDANGLIDVTPDFELDADGLLILPDGYELDADGLIILDFAWQTPPFVNPIPWRVDLCVGWERVGVCIAHHFTGTQRRNQAGDFTLEASPQGIPPAQGFDPRDVDTIRLVGGNRILFGGYVAGDDGGLTVERDDKGERWRWTGEDAWWLLRGKQAYPDPTVDSGWSVSHDVRTGIASSVLAEYLDANMGATVVNPAGTQTPFQTADEVVGPNYTFSARFQSLEELAQRIARDGGFEVVPEVAFDGTVTVRLSQARDLSGVVVFSDKGDLLSSRARFQHPEATYVLSAGTGEGTARLFRSSGPSDRASRREMFRDVSSLAEVTELQADADTQVALNAERYAITSTLTAALANIAIAFGLRLGDRLGISIDGRRYVLPIESVAFDVSPGRQLMTPQFGDAIPDELSSLLRKVASPFADSGVA